MARQNVFGLHITAEDDSTTLADLLAEASGLSRQKVKQVMQKGAVWLTHDRHTRRVRRAKTTPRQGDGIHLYYNKQVLSAEPPEPELVADEGGYSIWNKPCGLLFQGSKWGDHCSIHRWAEQHLLPRRPAFIVHRLDRAATGLILPAHSSSGSAKQAVHQP